MFCFDIIITFVVLPYAVVYILNYSDNSVSTLKHGVRRVETKLPKGHRLSKILVGIAKIE